MEAANAAQRLVERAWSAVPPERLQAYMRMRHNPLPGVTPESLRRMQDGWDAGWLQEFASTSRQMVRKDDMLRAVASKRHQSAMTRGWEICQTEKGAEADAHKAALEYCYNNLEVTVATEPDVAGSTGLLLEQMNEAVTYRWALHEIEPLPGPDGLTARLHYVTLDWFERTTGRLRFRADYAAPYGEELAAGGWLCHSADGLADAAAIVWLYKHMPLQDWLIYCSRHGMPGFLGKTGATPASKDWQAMERAVASLSAEWAGVISKDDDVEALQLGNAGELPYPPLVERMDRAFSILYRGADLATLSGGQGGQDSPGASVQAGETDRLDAADAVRLCDTLNRTLDQRVIAWHFGPRAKPKAYFAVRGLAKDQTRSNLLTDEALHRMGFPLDLQSLSERYGRPLPAPGAAVLPPPAASLPGLPGALGGANEAQGQLARLLGVQRRWLDPAAAEIGRMAAALSDPALAAEEALAAAAEILDRLPALADRMGDKDLADLFAGRMAAEAAEAIQNRKGGV